MTKTNKLILICSALFIAVCCLILGIATKPVKLNQDAIRLDEISKELEDISFQLEEIQAQQVTIDERRDELIKRQTELNEEANVHYLNLVTPEMQTVYNYMEATEIPLEEWQPGDLTEDGDHQLMPEIDSSISDSHERFKQLANAYGLDPSVIWNVENHYGIKEGVILCVTVAETSGGNRGAGGKNIGSVGSNDRGDRPTYALMEAGLEAIGKTLNNQYLGGHTTLGCLSNAGSCQESNDNGKRYATSTHSREANMTACLSEIYGTIDPATFNIRR